MRNLLIAISEYVPLETKPIIIKLTYDANTGLVDGLEFYDTDKPYIEISREQYEANLHFKRLRVVDGKLEEIPRIRLTKLALVTGDTWYTTNNMLIIGNERGWNERGNS
jgi:hypothetical protein